MRNFGQRLSGVLHQKKMEQRELAEVLGVTNRAVSAYVTGKSYPKMEHFIKMADYLDVSTDFLLGFTKNQKGIPFEDKTDPLKDDILTIKRCYEKLSARERKVFMDFVMGLAGEEAKERK